MQERLGTRLDHVRIHQSPEVDQLARSIDAEAFTVGADVFLAGRNQPAPDDRALAHELVHVAQQGGALQRQILFRLSASMCCKDPDARAPDVGDNSTPASNWKLTIAVDMEEEGLGRLKSGNVGHTWVKLSADNGAKWSYGFWPQVGYNSSKPWAAVAGCVHHPDTAHEPPAATKYNDIDYDLTLAGFTNAIDYAAAQVKAKPDYKLFSYNCTGFAIEMAKKAGVTPPDATTLAIPNPNALYEGIDEDKKKRAQAAQDAADAAAGPRPESLPGGVPDAGVAVPDAGS